MRALSRLRAPVARTVAWAAAGLSAGALYLLLIDTTSLPELIVLAVAAVLSASAFELAREQRIAQEAIRLRWLRRLYRAVLKAPSDIAVVCGVAVRQLVRPKAANGVFRAVPFRSSEDETIETGRRALAESFGSFAPNTIIVGIDPDRELILAHQLRRSGGREAIDLLELG